MGAFHPGGLRVQAVPHLWESESGNFEFAPELVEYLLFTAQVCCGTLRVGYSAEDGGWG